jgi:hypothetical protein
MTKQIIDGDLEYEQMRDEDTLFLEEKVKELVNNLKHLFYYKNRREGLAQDIIRNTLEQLSLKIGGVDNTKGLIYPELILIDEGDIK